MLEWEDFRVFLAVLRMGNFAMAARSLDIVPVTLRRSIERLERQAGQRLFLVDGRRLAPTPHALALKPVAEAMERSAEAFAAAAEAEREGFCGTVRVLTTEILGENVLMPCMARLRKEHPELHVELALTDGLAALEEVGADIGLRFLPPRPDGLVSETLGDISFGLFAHRDVLDAFGRPKTAEDLQRCPLIGARSMGTNRILFERLGIGLGSSAFKVRTDSVSLQWAMTCAGLGVGVGQVPLANRTPGLERVLPEEGLSAPLRISTHESRVNIARVRIVRHAIAEAAQHYLNETPQQAGLG